MLPLPVRSNIPPLYCLTLDVRSMHKCSLWANAARLTSNVVQNLEKDVTTRLLHDTFITFGPILSCKVALDKDLNSKGYGFVHFENPESAKAAIEQVDGARRLYKLFKATVMHIACDWQKLLLRSHGDVFNIAEEQCSFA